MFWINDLEAIEKAGEKVFLTYMVPQSIRRNIYAQWRKDAKNLTTLEQKIEKTNLQKIPSRTLLVIWKNFSSLYADFLVTGSVPELANYGSIRYLQRKIAVALGDERTQADILEVLTAPTRLSFYQEEEIHLLKSKNILKHQQKYFWLKNSYAGTHILSFDFFARRKKNLPSDFEKKATSRLKESIKKKKDVIRKYKFSDEIAAIADAISSGIGWQDERKKIILATLHYQDVLLHEISRRSGYPFSDLQLLGHTEIASVISGKDLHLEITYRKQGFGLQFFHSSRGLSPEEVSYFWDVYETKSEIGHVSEIRGISVSKGNGKKILGSVCILLDPSDAKDFKKGDILCAPMTSPEYIFAMKKAAAIVTDEGGLTSHAAIVSRELGIPCIVGTKIATKVLKNGDLVEVDAEKGVVTILKRMG
ncbi:hypothetical protein HY090_01510 [Candidatus Kaiserbacteria bacterium]|nr:hypothetical protein [Candidatus Kaiserbacteria bacterium]